MVEKEGCMTLNGHFLVILNPLNTTPEIAEERNPKLSFI